MQPNVRDLAVPIDSYKPLEFRKYSPGCDPEVFYGFGQGVTYLDIKKLCCRAGIDSIIVYVEIDRKIYSRVFVHDASYVTTYLEDDILQRPIQDNETALDVIVEIMRRYAWADGFLTVDDTYNRPLGSIVYDAEAITKVTLKYYPEISNISFTTDFLQGCLIKGSLIHEGRHHLYSMRVGQKHLMVDMDKTHLNVEYCESQPCISDVIEAAVLTFQKTLNT